MTDATPLLDVSELAVAFPTPDGVVEAVRGISFAVDRGRTLAIVGESGSGKSVATQTILGLTRGARVLGAARFEGADLLSMPPASLRAIRGARIGMIFQNPLSSLHPCYRIGWQIEEMIRAHEEVPHRLARARAVELLGLVGIAQPEQRVDDYPHQFSGGMLQRAMIAMAIALRPRLLIADEPTTALDVTVQAQIIRLMRDLQTRSGMAIIMITHDLGVVASMADEVLVMYAGRVMERAPRHALYHTPHHPYTAGLLESLPRPDESGSELTPIRGQPPSLINPPTGCPFHPRCAYAMPRCATESPPLAPIGTSTNHRSACWLPGTLTGTAPAVRVARADFAEAESRTPAPGGRGA